MTQNDDKHYEQLNAIERVKLALAKHTVGEPFAVKPEDVMARLHGQCEVHCWTSGKNRKWLAGIMKAGRASGLYREGQGWESVIEFLKARDDEPVVCSYSVCEQFPNFGCLPDSHPLKARSDEERFDEFYDIPEGEKWKLCFDELQKRRGLELTPRGWDKFFFMRGHNAFTLPRLAKVAA